MQKTLIYDKIVGKKNSIYIKLTFKGKFLWLLFNGWSRRFKIIKHCEVE